jgi:hypothetical protein
MAAVSAKPPRAPSGERPERDPDLSGVQGVQPMWGPRAPSRSSHHRHLPPQDPSAATRLRGRTLLRRARAHAAERVRDRAAQLQRQRYVRARVRTGRRPRRRPPESGRRARRARRRRPRNRPCGPSSGRAARGRKGLQHVGERVARLVAELVEPVRREPLHVLVERVDQHAERQVGLELGRRAGEHQVPAPEIPSA